MTRSLELCLHTLFKSLFEILAKSNCNENNFLTPCHDQHAALSSKHLAAKVNRGAVAISMIYFLH